MSMELSRLSNFALTHVTTSNRNVHLFAATPKASPAPDMPSPQDAGMAAVRKARNSQATAALAARYFARVVVHHASRDTTNGDTERQLDLDAHPEAENAFVEVPALRCARRSPAVDCCRLCTPLRSPSTTAGPPQRRGAFLFCGARRRIGTGLRSGMNSIFINFALDTTLTPIYIEAVVR